MSWVFGDSLGPVSGSARTAEELVCWRPLRRIRSTCGGGMRTCSWNHLVKSYVLGAPKSLPRPSGPSRGLSHPERRATTRTWPVNSDVPWTGPQPTTPSGRGGTRLSDTGAQPASRWTRWAWGEVGKHTSAPPRPSADDDPCRQCVGTSDRAARSIDVVKRALDGTPARRRPAATAAKPPVPGAAVMTASRPPAGAGQLAVGASAVRPPRRAGDRRAAGDLRDGLRDRRHLKAGDIGPTRCRPSLFGDGSGTGEDRSAGRQSGRRRHRSDRCSSATP